MTREFSRQECLQRLKTKADCFQAKGLSNKGTDMKFWFATTALGATLIGQILGGATYAQELPQFSAPLDCVNGPECFVQNLTDLDPTKGRLDPMCGQATYDGHKGTDIRVRSFQEMNQGVDVLAMADGIVLRVRDGVADKLVETKADFAAVKGAECGNGVVIDHSRAGYAGWSSQICHMKNGSVNVKAGDKVKRGQKIGQVGLSGSTQFPHVHVTVRKDGQVRDLLTNLKLGDGCAGQSVDNLFSKTAWSDIVSRNQPLIDAGFANGPVNGKTLLRNKVVLPTTNTPLVFYAKFINLKKGDEVLLEVRSEDGVYAVSQGKPLTKHQATYTAFAGRKTPGKAGKTYLGSVKLIRAGEVAFQKDGIEIRF
jgi:murein DD-endopeptidase MepM/ murein hydrolase activator NlpD